MAKAKPSIFNSGYSDWSIRRTISEAENVARWNPWLAHEWMGEARNRISIHAPFYDEYDRAVERINAYWKTLPRMHYHNPRDFWSKNGVHYPPTYLDTIVQDSEETSLDDIISKTFNF